MSQINVNTITDEAGTGPVNLNTGLSVGGNEIITAAGALTNVTSIDATTVATINSAIPPVPAHNPTTVSGATQALNVGSYNFFNAGDLSVDTTISFTSVPTDALWTYTAKAGIGEGYTLEAAAYSGLSKSIIDQGADQFAATFSSDGTKMYTFGITSTTVYQYTLATAWDVSTATYASLSVSVAAQSANPRGMGFSSDGTKMYIADVSAGYIYQYTLATAWNISTATYASLSKSVAAQEPYPSGIAFSSDGTKMYVIGYNTDSIYQYSLATAWNVSTATYASLSKSVNAQDIEPRSLAFNTDGTRLFFMGSNTKRAYQYTLSTAWNISTATYASLSVSVAAVTGTDPVSLALSSDGTKMYVAGYTNGTVYQYNSSIGTTITIPAAVQNPPTTTLYPDSQVSYTFVTNDGGTTVKLINETVL